MAKIIGNTTVTPMAVPDWNQTNETKADYIKNKPILGDLSSKDIAEKSDLAADIQESLEKADTVTTLMDRVSANENAILALNGGGTGSLDQRIADAINEFAAKVSDDGTVNTYKELIDYAATHGPEFTELVGEVDANAKSIETINDAEHGILSQAKAYVNEKLDEIETALGGIINGSY